MKRLFIILLNFVCLCANAQTGTECFSMNGLGKLLNNISAQVTWIGKDGRWLTYTPQTENGREYHIVDTRSWKVTPMFDNKEFADKLNAISQTGGGRIL